MKRSVSLFVALVSLFLNVLQAQPDFTFSTRIHPFTFSTIYNQVQVVDYNGDGLLDIVALNLDDIVVMPNKGNLTFGPPEVIFSLDNIRTFSFTHINEDPYIDFIAIQSSNSVYDHFHYFLSDNQGEYQNIQPAQERKRVDSFELADLDNDGQDEIYVGSSSEVDRLILRNDSLVRQNLIDEVTFGYLNALSCVDLNGDGKKEFVANNGGLSREIYLFEEIDGQWQGSVLFDNFDLGFERKYKMVQYDEDPDLELLVYSDNQFQVFELDDTEENLVELFSGAENNNHIEAVSVDDFDEDGDIDYFLFSSESYDPTKIFYADNDGQNFNRTVFPTSFEINNVNFAVSEDFDNDGDKDVIFRFVNSGQGYIAVLENNTLTPTIDFSKNNTVSLFPNPLDHSITISLDEYVETDANRLIHFDIIDETGKNILSVEKMYSSSVQIDVASLRSGNYFICFRNGDQLIRKQFHKL